MEQEEQRSGGALGVDVEVVVIVDVQHPLPLEEVVPCER